MRFSEFKVVGITGKVELIFDHMLRTVTRSFIYSHKDVNGIKPRFAIGIDNK